MKIGVVVCAYAPYRAGICVAAERHSQALVDLGHQVEVICPADEFGSGWSIIDGIRVYRRRPLVRSGLGAVLPTLVWQARAYDALYLHCPFFGGEEPAALGAWLSRTPYLAYFHMDVILDGWRGAAIRAHRRLLAPHILRGAREVLVSSRDYLDHSSIAALELPRVREVPYSVDTEVFSPAELSGERRRALGLDASRPVVLFVGTLGRAGAFKGVENLIRAMAGNDLHRTAQVVFAGDGELRTHYESAAERLLPPDAFHFAGRVSDEDLIDLYRGATVTVLPSTTQGEAFGIVLIESMACGTPVIASALPGVRGVVGAEAGTGVPPGDVPELSRAIARVLGDPNYAQRRVASRDRALSHYSRASERDALARSIAALA